MNAEKKEVKLPPAEPKVPTLKVKIVSYADYLKEARELLIDHGNVNGMTNKWDIAVSLLYDRHEVIAIVQKAGETRFVCKA